MYFSVVLGAKAFNEIWKLKVPGGPENPDHILKVVTRVCDGAKMWTIYQTVQCFFWSKIVVLKFVTVLCSNLKQHCNENNHSPIMHVITVWQNFIEAERSMYQNIQYPKRNKKCVLNFMAIRYSLHKCSEAILR